MEKVVDVFSKSSGTIILGIGLAIIVAIILIILVKKGLLYKIGPIVFKKPKSKTEKPEQKIVQSLPKITLEQVKILADPKELIDSCLNCINEFNTKVSNIQKTTYDTTVATLTMETMEYSDEKMQDTNLFNLYLKHDFIEILHHKIKPLLHFTDNPMSQEHLTEQIAEIAKASVTEFKMTALQLSKVIFAKKTIDMLFDNNTHVIINNLKKCFSSFNELNKEYKQKLLDLQEKHLQKIQMLIEG